MLKTELLEIIANHENSGVEFKRDDMPVDDIARICVAFANVRGGRVLLGVENDGTISGLTRNGEKCQEWVMDTLFSKYVHPLLTPFYEEVTFEDGKRVGIITVSEGPQKPYIAKYRGQDIPFVRLGNTTQKATREQQMRMLELGKFLHVETLVIPGTRFEDLDERRLRQYLLELVGYEKIPDSQDAWEIELKNLGLMTQTDIGGAMCTIAGILLFGIAPRRKFPYAGVRVFVFPGLDKDYNALKDEIIADPLTQLWKPKTKTKILEEDIVTRVLSAIQEHVSKEKLKSKIRRERVWEYPKEAIRELLVNALVHRDYTRQVDIEVGVYSNRIEIVSPGSPPNGLNLEKMKSGQRIQRNPILVEILRDYGLAESRGMGIRRKVIPLMIEQNGTEPVFEITEDYVKVTLFKTDPNN